MESYFDNMRKYEDRQLLTSGYETLLYEIRKNEKDL